jgi:hypothetical protein
MSLREEDVFRRCLPPSFSHDASRGEQPSVQARLPSTIRHPVARVRVRMVMFASEGG